MTSRHSRRTGCSSSGRRRGERHWDDTDGGRFSPGGYGPESSRGYWDYSDDTLTSSEDDDTLYSDSGDNTQIAGWSSRSKGKGTTSMGSLRRTHNRREDYGGGEDGYEAGDEGSRMGQSSHRRSFHDSDGYHLPPHLSHSSSRPSSSSGPNPRDPRERLSYDSQRYPITSRTRYSDNHPSLRGHYQGSRHQPDPNDPPPRRNSSRARSSSRPRSRVSFAPSDEVFEYDPDSSLPGGDSGPDLASRSSRHHSRTSRSRYYGREDLDEDSPPPPYSRQLSSGGSPGGGRDRSEGGWREDEDGEEDDVSVDDGDDEDGYIRGLD